MQEVEDGSPAEDAGLEAGDDKIDFQGQPEIVIGGDVIVAVDGKRLTRTQDLTDMISTYGAGDTVKLTLLRDGKRRDGERIELRTAPERLRQLSALRFFLAMLRAWRRRAERG